jgi:hypothetical protein
VVLHHSRQNANGPLFEISQSAHQVARNRGGTALHPYGNSRNPNFPVDRRAFASDRAAYWRARADAFGGN